MKKYLTLTLTLLMTFVAGTAHAFFNEVAELKLELQVWESANAADFTDVLDQLDNITGPVFRDVSEADWFNPYVSSLAEWGIVSGYYDENGRATGEFRSANPVTIAEALKMSMKSAKIDETQCLHQPLHPEAETHWAKLYVACAEQMNVRLLNPSAPASLNRPAKRAEVLTIIHDVFRDKVLSLYSNFSDTSGHAFEADVAYANLSGLVNGDRNAAGAETGTFRPDDAINRAEFSKIIYERLKLDVSVAAQ